MLHKNTLSITYPLCLRAAIYGLLSDNGIVQTKMIMEWHKRRLFTWQQLDSGSGRQASGKFHLPKIPLHVERISWCQTITHLQFPMKYNIGINKYTISSSFCVFTMTHWPHGSNVISGPDILGYLQQCFYWVGCNDTVVCYSHIEFFDILQTVAILETCTDSLLPLMYGI